MLKRLGLEQLLGLGFGLVLVIVTIAGLIAIRGQIALRNAGELALRDSHSANLAQHLSMLQQREQATSRAYFLEPANHGDVRCAEAARAFAATIDQINEGVQDDASRALLEQVRDHWQAGENELQKMFALGRGGQKDAMLAELPTSVRISKQIQDSVAHYVDRVEDLAHQRELEQKRISRQVLWVTSSLIGLSFVIAIVCCVLTIRIVSRRVEQAKVALDAIANMDLSRKEIEVFTYDALGHALRSVNQMKRQLTSVVAELGRIGGHVAGAATELTASAEGSAHAVDEQRARAEHLATTLTEMSSSVAEIARHSAVTSQSAGEANVAVREGEEAVELTTAKMAEITEQSAVVTRSIEDLVKISDDIGRAANLIRDIAGQTNLLALNAAIEAARAGENGKGFSVVAAEVRKLAVQTGTATNEIESMIQTVQLQAKSALEKTREEHVHIAEGVALTQTTRESFTNIRKSVSTVDSMMEQIAAAAQEQAAATEDLNQNLNGIVQLIARSTTAAHEASTACAELSKLSEQMHARVSDFVLPEEDESRSVHLSGGRSASRIYSAA